MLTFFDEQIIISSTVELFKYFHFYFLFFFFSFGVQCVNMNNLKICAIDYQFLFESINIRFELNISSNGINTYFNYIDYAVEEIL